MSGSKSFRLASVLRVAKLREQQRERELAMGLADDRRAEEMTVIRLDAYESRPEEPVGAPVGALRAQAVVDARERRQAAADELVAIRGRWLDATRQRRVLEELESRHHAAAALVATRASQRALDDLARKRQVVTP